MGCGRASWLLCACAVWLGCGSPTASYQMIEASQAREMLDAGDVTLVDAVAAAPEAPALLPGGIRWRLDEGRAEVPGTLGNGQPILVVSANPEVAHRAAAALARLGNPAVFVCIPRDAAERSSLYAGALPSQEVRRGRDS